MKAETLPASSGLNASTIILGVLAVLLIVAVITGRKVPVLTSDRAALLGLVVIGMAICGPTGIGRVAARGEWAHPLSIAGYLLGAAILLIGIAAAFGKHIPPLASFHQSFIAVVVISAVKVVLTTIHRLL